MTPKENEMQMTPVEDIDVPNSELSPVPLKYYLKTYKVSQRQKLSR